MDSNNQKDAAAATKKQHEMTPLLQTGSVQASPSGNSNNNDEESKHDGQFLSLANDNNLINNDNNNNNNNKTNTNTPQRIKPGDSSSNMKMDDPDNDVNDEDDASQLSSLLKSPMKNFEHVLRSPDHKYTVGTAIIFSLNYTFGSGVLGLPYEYFETGYILSVLLLIWCGLLTYVLCHLVGNLMYRAEALTTMLLNHTDLAKHEFLDDPQLIVSSLTNNENNINITINDFINEYNKGIEKNEYELSYLIGMFCGKKWRVAYEWTFSIQETLSLWSYNVLFGASMARFAGISGISSSCNIERTDADSYTSCRALYTLYNCMFWVWCCILVLMNFKQQTGIQISSFVARLIIVFLMIITSIGLIYGNLEYSSDTGEYTKRSDDSVPYYGNNVSAFKFSGLLYFVASAFFAFNCQFSVPDVVQPLRVEDRSQIGKIYGINIMVLIVIWSFVGITVSLYFGSDIEDPCTLAWKYFRGFFWEDGDRPGWSYFVAYIVLLLPPIDMMSSFPLNAITLCNTIEQGLFDIEKITEAHEIAAEHEHNHEHGNINDNDNPASRYLLIRRVVVRVTLVTFAAIMALIVWEYDTIIVFSGLFALISLYFIPAYAVHKSQEICAMIANDENAYITPINSWTSHIFWIYACYVTCIIGVAGVVYELAS